MSLQTYHFYELGSIPGVPGQFPAGTCVLLDTDTHTIVDTYPVATTLAAEREEANTPSLAGQDMQTLNAEVQTLSAEVQALEEKATTASKRTASNTQEGS